MTQALRQLVRERAGQRCEYCQLQQEDSPLAALHIEHIRPGKHGGNDDADNLALACIDCNLRKGSNLTGVDPDSGQVTLLFHPRQDEWAAHFMWMGIHILGMTDVGRTTVQVLDLNCEDRMDLRLAGEL